MGRRAQGKKAAQNQAAPETGALARRESDRGGKKNTVPSHKGAAVITGLVSLGGKSRTSQHGLAGIYGDYIIKLWKRGG